MALLTIFTPVYNRAHMIGQLYDSLVNQTSGEFEWLVVDDGSTDNIKDVINAYIDEGKIDIKFFSQPNGGKHRAINRGLREAQGELFFIVDSDDFVTTDAVEWILKKWEEIKDDETFAGLSGIRITPEGKKIGGDGNFGQIDTDDVRIREVHDVKGDLAEIFRTKILREFTFPEYEGEKFCPEKLIWTRMANAGYKLRYSHYPTYVCQYHPDGLSANSDRHRFNSPEASMAYYAEQIGHPLVRLKKKAGYSILFWCFSLKSKKSFTEKARMLPPVWRLMAPFGWMYRIKKYKAIKH